MWPIYQRELQSLFYAPLGYLLLSLFYIINGLFLWVFDTEWNMLSAGYGDLNLFFELNPWLLIVLIPAIGMKSFSEELKLGTIEILMTKPLAQRDLVLGKYLAQLSLILIALLSSLIYLYLINQLLFEEHSFDWGVFIGSFLGLFLLAACLCAISLWASTLFDNAISAFLVAFFIGIFHFYGWNQLALAFGDFDTYYFIKNIALQTHFSELNKGVIRISNMIYLVGQSVFFLYWSSLNLNKMRR